MCPPPTHLLLNMTHALKAAWKWGSTRYRRGRTSSAITQQTPKCTADHVMAAEDWLRRVRVIFSPNVAIRSAGVPIQNTNFEMTSAGAGRGDVRWRRPLAGGAAAGRPTGAAPTRTQHLLRENAVGAREDPEDGGHDLQDRTGHV